MVCNQLRFLIIITITYVTLLGNERFCCVIDVCLAIRITCTAEQEALNPKTSREDDSLINKFLVFDLF